MSEDFFNQTLFDNPISNYCWFAGILFAAFVFKKFISVRLSKLLYAFFRKHSEGVAAESFVMLLSKPIKLFILIIASYLAFDRLAFPGSWNLVPVEQFGVRMILFKTFYCFILVSLIWMLLRSADFLGLVLAKKASKTSSRGDDQLVVFIKEGTKILIGIFGLFIILGSVFNLNISSLIAGLGIGGLAVALAAKETIENLIGSFTIFLDKPFVLGDLVKVGNITGIVERIGFRSTGIRTPEKTVVAVPNKKMVDAETENLSMRNQRMAKLILGITLASSTDQLKSLLSDIRKILKEHPLVNEIESIAFFSDIGNRGYEFEIEYAVKTLSNQEYFKTKEEVNFLIMNAVNCNECKLTTPFLLPNTK